MVFNSERKFPISDASPSLVVEELYYLHLHRASGSETGHYLSPGGGGGRRKLADPRPVVF